MPEACNVVSGPGNISIANLKLQTDLAADHQCECLTHVTNWILI